MPAVSAFDEAYISAHKSLVDGDTQVALPALQELARSGNVEATILLGWAYLTGFGFPQSLSEAKNHLAKAAALGSAAGSFYLGRAYAMEGNMGKATECYQSASAQGFSPAQFRLGLAYRDGRGVQRDLINARRLLDTAARSGHRMALRELSLMEIRGAFGMAQIPIGSGRMVRFLALSIVDIIFSRQSTEHVT